MRNAESEQPDAIEIVLNGRGTQPAEARAVIAASFDSYVLTEKGGYVFKATLDAGRAMIGLLPAFLDGRKMYHYDISLAREDQTTLVGMINPNGSITILPRTPPAGPCDGATLAALRRSLQALAGLFVRLGGAGRVRLDGPTRQFLRESGLFAAPPVTLQGLAEQDAEHSRSEDQPQ